MKVINDLTSGKIYEVEETIEDIAQAQKDAAEAIVAEAEQNSLRQQMAQLRDFATDTGYDYTIKQLIDLFRILLRVLWHLLNENE